MSDIKSLIESEKSSEEIVNEVGTKDVSSGHTIEKILKKEKFTSQDDNEHNYDYGWDSSGNIEAVNKDVAEDIVGVLSKRNIVATQLGNKVIFE